MWRGAAGGFGPRVCSGDGRCEWQTRIKRELAVAANGVLCGLADRWRTSEAIQAHATRFSR
jgi:hypothetical protein